jgi:hypothetical protein
LVRAVTSCLAASPFQRIRSEHFTLKLLYYYSSASRIRRSAPFKWTDSLRIRYLSVSERTTRILNLCYPLRQLRQHPTYYSRFFPAPTPIVCHGRVGCSSYSNSRIHDCALQLRLNHRLTMDNSTAPRRRCTEILRQGFKVSTLGSQRAHSSITEPSSISCLKWSSVHSKSTRMQIGRKQHIYVIGT